MTQQAAIILTIITTFIIAIAYAWYIAKRPFPTGLTWISVVIGCSITNAGLSFTLWSTTGNPLTALLPWGFYALTGIPTILCQILKDHYNLQEADIFLEEMRQ